MAYTLPTELTVNLSSGVSTVLNAVKITTTGAKTPFMLPKNSGIYWGQVTFHVVLQSITVLTAALEVDLTNTDANFVTMNGFTGINLFASPSQVFNLNGGNARYRWNITTLTDGGTDGCFIWAVAG